MKLNKLAAAGLAGVLLTGILAGCGGRSESNAQLKNMFTHFNTTDLDGNTVTESIFEDNDLTMINTWATWCGPGVSELPELDALQKELRAEGKKVAVKGMVIVGKSAAAGLTEDEKQEAKNVLKKAGAGYQQLLASDEIIEAGLKNQAGFPTTYFVDHSGKLVGEPVIGSNNLEDWKKEVEKKLGELADE